MNKAVRHWWNASGQAVAVNGVVGTYDAAGRVVETGGSIAAVPATVSMGTISIGGAEQGIPGGNNYQAQATVTFSGTLKSETINPQTNPHPNGCGDAVTINATTATCYDAGGGSVVINVIALSTGRFNVYRRKDVSSALHYDANPREGDPVIVPNGPYTFRTKPLSDAGPINGTLHGGHGFDPNTMPEMKAIFFAEGPDIKPGAQLPTFENVNVYPFITRLLDIRTPVSDGSLEKLTPALRGSVVQIVRATTKRTAKSYKLEQPSTDEAIKIGLGVTPPQMLNRVDVEYTDKARRAKLTGTVLLKVRIEKDGRPSRVEVVRGLGMGLDEQAIKAASGSTFRPALKDGTPVVVETQMEYNFELF